MIEQHDLDQNHLLGFGHDVVRLKCKDEQGRQEQREAEVSVRTKFCPVG